MTGQTAWITGANGFFGRALTARLVRDGWHVVALGNALEQLPDFTSRSETEGADTENGTLSIMPGTLDGNLVLAACTRYGSPATVFHLAGGASVGSAEGNPARDFRRTVQSTADLVHVLGRQPVRSRLLYPSSAAVYGSHPPGPISEDMPTIPVSHYGWHKLAAENLCRQAADRYGINTTVVRFFSLYGPGLRKQIFWDLGTRMLKGEDVIELGGTGHETRDFLHIDDAVEILFQLAGASNEGLQVFNGGSGQATRISDAATMLGQALASRCPVRFTGLQRPGDPSHYQADLTRLHAFGFHPLRTLDSGLAEYARWLLDECHTHSPVG